jgi:quercetin dioxygenase-like cupin family protein
MLSTAALEELARTEAARLGGWRHRRGGEHELRSGLRLARTDDSEVWLLCWPPGARVTPHDHGASAGAFMVLSGRLTEVRWDDGRRTESALEPGQVVYVAPGDVHDVLADAAPAYSVHAYSPPLSTMSFYDTDGRRVLRTEIVEDTPAEFESSVAR